jgi:hypothetical protein
MNALLDGRGCLTAAGFAAVAAAPVGKVPPELASHLAACGRCQQRLLAGGVEREGVHVEADIVAREQPAVAIEGGVLDRLGRDRRAQLLEAGDRAGVGLRLEEAQHRIDGPAIGGEAGLARAVGCPGEHGAVLGRQRAANAIGAIDRETGDDFGNCFGQRVQREIARAAILLGDAIELVPQHADFARHRRLHDQLFAGVNQLLKSSCSMCTPWS